MHQIGIRVPPAKIFFWNKIHHASRRCTQHAFKNLLRIGAGDGVHGVKAHGEPACEHFFYRFKIKQLLHQGGIIRNRINNFNFHALKIANANLGQVGCRRLNDFEFFNFSGARINSIGKRFGCRPPASNVKLDAKITLCPPPIVTGGKNQTTKCTP